MGSQAATTTPGEAAPSNPYEQYRWRRASSGLLERDVDEAERFYTSFCRRADDPDKAAFAITGSASFSVPIASDTGINNTLSNIEAALRDAWIGLRRECPGLASWIQYDAGTETWKRFYSPFDDTPDPATAENKWLFSTFRIEETDLSEAEWFNTGPPVFKLPTLFLVRPASPASDGGEYRATVVFRSPHDTLDGHGILQLFNRLFELAADAYKGAPNGTANKDSQEFDILPPPMRIAAAILPKPTDAQKQRFRDVMPKNGAMALGLPQLGLPISAGSGTSNRKQRVFTTLSKPLTSQLLTKCKEQGFTVTHAISAAVVLALRDAQPPTDEPKDLRYYMQALMSIRHMCQPPFDSLANAAGNYHMVSTQGMGVDIQVGGDGQTKTEKFGEEFTDISHQFRKYYVSVRPSGTPEASRDDLDLAPLTWSVITPRTAPGEAPAEESTASGAVGISSLGNITSMVKADRNPFSLTNVWVAGESSGSSTPVMLGGYNGKIEVSAIFDEAYHAKDYMKEFQRNVLRIAVKGLGLLDEKEADSHIV